MSLIQLVLSGALPPAVEDAKRRAYHRAFWHAHPEYKQADAERKRERYATDPEFRERRKEDERGRRAAMTPEQRAADRQRRKNRLVALSAEEYERRMRKQAEKSKRWRAKVKLSQENNPRSNGD